MSQPLADLAVEFWKLLQNYDRFISVVPESAQARLAAQSRFGAARLSAILEAENMRMVTYEGNVFEPNLPVTAINDDGFADTDIVLIEKTIEPTVMRGMDILKIGKVFLVKNTEKQG
ncbi:hypothetical protein V9K92_14905 [Phyllobacterium sp. CCNWLW109]|uniref:hypothetical protein n=1 Tax=Phyllobacterium sp. CCNWLW109 TaxID=3127479 RepID=UPI0030786ED9